MKNTYKNILLDANICIDILTLRNSTKSEIKELILFIKKHKINLHISSNTLDTIYYVVKRMGNNPESVKKRIESLVSKINLIHLSDKAVNFAFNSNFKDFEDSLINASAVVNKIDVILTKNKKDFKNSSLLVCTSKELFKLLN